MAPQQVQRHTGAVRGRRQAQHLTQRQTQVGAVVVVVALVALRAGTAVMVDQELLL